ncbi:MAG: ACT domain-containing protein [Verrucomicrobiota bacterium]
MNTVKLVTVFVENKTGQLARYTKILADTGINIRWVTIATSERFGVMKFLVDQFEPACQALRQDGLAVSQVEVLAIEVPDKPGGLHAVADCLARSNVNVENSSGFVTQAHQRAILIIETKDIEHARQALKKQGVHLLNPEELTQM